MLVEIFDDLNNHLGLRKSRTAVRRTTGGKTKTAEKAMSGQMMTRV